VVFCRRRCRKDCTLFFCVASPKHANFVVPIPRRSIVFVQAGRACAVDGRFPMNGSGKRLGWGGGFGWDRWGGCRRGGLRILELAGRGHSTRRRARLGTDMGGYGRSCWAGRQRAAEAAREGGARGGGGQGGGGHNKITSLLNIILFSKATTDT